jgi:hypothetical protein
VGKFRDPYRPERHYMRGPGPKWQAKHTASLIAAAGAQHSLGGEAPPAPKAKAHGGVAAWVAPTAAAALLGFAAVMILA